MKKLLVIAVAAGLIAPAAAMADTTLYGVLSASVGQVKNDGGKAETAVESHASRFGVKGSSALDNGLSATYGLEFQTDLDGDTSNGITTRNQFVGLKGGFGEVRVGKHDTPHKLATAGLDNFADTYADSGVNGVLTERRVENAVAYINKFGPVGVAVAHTTGVGTAGETAAAHSLDANSLMVNYSNGPWYAALGHEAVQTAGKNTKVGLGWKAEAGHFANLVYEKDSDAIAGTDTGTRKATTEKGKAYLVGGGYKMGNVTLKAQYGEKKFDDAALAKVKQTTLGADYSLGKKTTAYLLSHKKDVGNTTAGDTQVTAVGLKTEF